MYIFFNFFPKLKLNIKIKIIKKNDRFETSLILFRFNEQFNYQLNDYMQHPKPSLKIKNKIYIRIHENFFSLLVLEGSRYSFKNRPLIGLLYNNLKIYMM